MEVEGQTKRQPVELPWQMYALQGFASSTGAGATYCLTVLYGLSWWHLLPGLCGLLVCGVAYLIAKRRCVPTATVSTT